ncbi:MAG TPA: ATP-binding protein [Bradyrhizobium sp.]|uniref:sensor histidine kinase n=1 Tax=Bradyrhizobium sp. TaxID=376 RepID=UPI002C87B8CF|nr:ATP-binding protein [Bradyrhizobium sp.]HLZ01258.1 ATP-binding protein [Bradyrhizobium sp.]
MTEGAARPSVPATRVLRARNTGTRLAQYSLLQAAIAALLIFLLQQRLPEPPATTRVTSFSLTDRGATRAVTPPAFVPSRSSMKEPAIFTGRFSWSTREKGRTWSVYLPRFTNGVAVDVNGVEILDSRRDPSANRPDRATPEIAIIPASLLRDGENALVIHLFVWVPISGFLDKVYVGPDEELRRDYEQRTLWFVTLPTVFAAWQGILAVILTVMWTMRRGEAAYGALAAAMALGAIQAFLSSTIDQPAHPELNAALLASAPLESGFVLTFGILFFGRKWPRLLGPLIFVPGVILVLIGVFGDPFTLRKSFLIIGMPALVVHLVLLGSIVAWSEMRRPDVPGLLLGCGVTIVLTSLVHDIVEVAGFIPDDRVFFTRLSYSAMLVAIGAGLTWRFARALNRVDGFAAHLAIQLREAEEKLKASFAREQERERAAALARERTRLMRDLHDGLGGQLVSIVALSERNTDSAGIGDAARAALKDLRLVIDSMDDIGGDLMLALASWRDRAAAQLRPHDIALDWRAAPPGLPVYPELRPWHVIQIIRILDEAVTNAVKHAAARRISVRIETVGEADGEHGCITVADDGKGFATDGEKRRASRGLSNMKNRAARCGAALELSSGDGGTTVRLQLPRRFPEGDAAAG